MHTLITYINYIHTYLRTYVRTLIITHTNYVHSLPALVTYMHYIHTYLPTYVYVRAYVHTYVRTCMHAYIHTRISYTSYIHIVYAYFLQIINNIYYATLLLLFIYPFTILFLYTICVNMRWACILVHVLYIFVCYEFIVSPGHGPMGLFSRYRRGKTRLSCPANMQTSSRNMARLLEALRSIAHRSGRSISITMW